MTKAGNTLARTYEIKAKENVSLDATLVNRGYLYIANGANGSIVDTVTVFQGADIAYADTRFAAVTAYDVVWAPFNCGATEPIGKDEVITTWTAEKCGYLYQWGRNVPFAYGGEPGDLYTGDLSVLDKYPNYNDACKNEGVYANKFIKASGNTWFKDYKTGSILTGDNAWPRENQPCPEGWRVPTKAELGKIDAISPRQSNGKWVSPDNNRFIMPSAGYRDGTGTSFNLGSEGCYWSSTYDAQNACSYRLGIQTGGSIFGTLSVSYTFLIRCVHE